MAGAGAAGAAAVAPICQAREGVASNVPSNSKSMAAATPPAPVENLIQNRINAAGRS
jgi:hypothetical protein